MKGEENGIPVFQNVTAPLFWSSQTKMANFVVLHCDGT